MFLNISSRSFIFQMNYDNMLDKTIDLIFFLIYKSYFCHLRGNTYSFIHSFKYYRCCCRVACFDNKYFFFIPIFRALIRLLILIAVTSSSQLFLLISFSVRSCCWKRQNEAETRNVLRLSKVSEQRRLRLDLRVQLEQVHLRFSRLHLRGHQSRSGHCPQAALSLVVPNKHLGKNSNLFSGIQF